MSEMTSPKVVLFLPPLSLETLSTFEPRSYRLVALRLRREPAGDVVEINQPNAVVGRHSGADLRLLDPDISRRHCRIYFEEGYWRIADLASTNGVYLNGKCIEGAALYPGDHLRIGGVEFTVERAAPTIPLNTNRRKSDALRSIREVVKSADSF